MTAPSAEQQWTCFHCGETFTTVGEARDHFGASEGADPGCLIDRVAVEEGGKPERGRGLLMALRKAEAEIEKLRASDEARDRDAECYHGQTAELARLFDGARTAYGAWLKWEAMEGRALAAEERADAAEALSQSLTEAQGEIARLKSELATVKADEGFARSAMNNLARKVTDAEMALASLTEEREGLRARVTEISYVCHDQADKLVALTAAHERVQKDADWWKAIVTSPPTCHGGPMKLRAANDTTASWGCTACGAVDELSRSALASPEGTPSAEPNVRGQDFPCLKCGESFRISWETMLHTGICDKCMGTPSAQDGR